MDKFGLHIYDKLVAIWNGFAQQIFDNIIKEDRYMLYWNGLTNTLLLTLCAAVLGIFIGAIVAICKVYAKTNKGLRPLEIICDTYLTVIRGTPVTVQLLIFCFIVFSTAAMNQMIYVAMLTFGINSGAYVAEIVRAGIQAVSPGQTEAGRSLGLTNNMTMLHIVFPQAIKNILPALANEAIVLLKETAIVGLVAVSDITYSATLIRSRTYSPVPLLFVALIYLIVVMFMTWLLRKFEKSLARSDRK